MIINKPYSNKQYAQLAIYCNSNNCHIEDKGDFLEAVENPVYEPTYAEKRAAEYPSIAEQLDMIYWDKINGTTVWSDTIGGIKDKYPKPAEESFVVEEEVLDESSASEQVVD